VLAESTPTPHVLGVMARVVAALWYKCPLNPRLKYMLSTGGVPASDREVVCILRNTTTATYHACLLKERTSPDPTRPFDPAERVLLRIRVWDPDSAYDKPTALINRQIFARQLCLSDRMLVDRAVDWDGSLAATFVSDNRAAEGAAGPEPAQVPQSRLDVTPISVTRAYHLMVDATRGVSDADACIAVATTLERAGSRVGVIDRIPPLHSRSAAGCARHSYRVCVGAKAGSEDGAAREIVAAALDRGDLRVVSIQEVRWRPYTAPGRATGTGA
jgi:hypothetical protein